MAQVELRKIFCGRGFELPRLEVPSARKPQGVLPLRGDPPVAPPTAPVPTARGCVRCSQCHRTTVGSVPTPQTLPVTEAFEGSAWAEGPGSQDQARTGIPFHLCSWNFRARPRPDPDVGVWSSINRCFHGPDISGPDNDVMVWSEIFFQDHIPTS